MSMDEQYEMMLHFEHSLAAFNDRLRASIYELENQHENISPLWQDEMRHEYDTVWGEFEEAMHQYIEKEGPSYVEFLNIKIHALRRYLYG